MDYCTLPDLNIIPCPSKYIDNIEFSEAEVFEALICLNPNEAMGIDIITVLSVEEATFLHEVVIIIRLLFTLFYTISVLLIMIALQIILQCPVIYRQHQILGGTLF